MLLHCYVNPDHEARVKAIVQRELPHAFVTASHKLSQEYREFERCSTVAANAYIGPVVSEYVRGIDEHLKQAGFGGSFLLCNPPAASTNRTRRSASACACSNPVRPPA